MWVFLFCLADGTENLGLGNCECTNDNIVSQEDREVKEDVQDDAKIGTQGGSGQ